MKRRCFTLIEILLVMALLAIVGGVLGFSIKRSVDHQHFEASVEAVVSRIQLAQGLCVNLDINNTVTLERNGDKGIEVVVHPEDALPQHLQGLAKPFVAHRQLQAILLDGYEGDQSLTFVRGMMPQGTLHFVPRSGSEGLYLALTASSKYLQATAYKPQEHYEDPPPYPVELGYEK